MGWSLFELGGGLFDHRGLGERPIQESIEETAVLGGLGFRLEGFSNAETRIVILGSEAPLDMRADGTLANGVHDDSSLSGREISIATPLQNLVLVLYPDGMSVQVCRWREAPERVLAYPLATERLSGLNLCHDGRQACSVA